MAAIAGLQLLLNVPEVAARIVVDNFGPGDVYSTTTGISVTVCDPTRTFSSCTIRHRPAVPHGLATEETLPGLTLFGKVLDAEASIARRLRLLLYHRQASFYGKSTRFGCQMPLHCGFASLGPTKPLTSTARRC